MRSTPPCSDLYLMVPGFIGQPSKYFSKNPDLSSPITYTKVPHGKPIEIDQTAL